MKPPDGQKRTMPAPLPGSHARAILGPAKPPSRPHVMQGAMIQTKIPAGSELTSSEIYSDQSVKMDWRIGQVVPLDAERGIWRRDWTPAWFIFTTPAQREFNAMAWLSANGCQEVWFPTEVRWRKVPRGKRSKVKYLAPVAPRYVFAFLPAEPHWDVLFSRARGKLLGVVSRDAAPIPIADADMARMQMVPQRIIQAREAERQARIIRPGDRASVTAGPLSGWTVDVESIHAGIARIIVPLLGKSSVEISADQLVKTQGLEMCTGYGIHE